MKYLSTSCVIAAVCLCIPSAGYASLESDVSWRTELEPSRGNITLTFGQPINLDRSKFELIDEGNARVPLLQLRAEDRNVILPVDRDWKPGAYTVRWHATYWNGQVDEGHCTFEIGR